MNRTDEKGTRTLTYDLELMTTLVTIVSVRNIWVRQLSTLRPEQLLALDHGFHLVDICNGLCRLGNDSLVLFYVHHRHPYKL